MNAVAFGKSKGKGKPMGYPDGGYQPSGAKGLKGFDKGQGGEKVERMGKAGVLVVSLRRTQRGLRSLWDLASLVGSKDTQVSIAILKHHPLG